jgi:hypothetical protein
MKEQKQIRHQEWFEVSQERAIRVLSTWAEFFKKAKPYERSGSLRYAWRNVVNVMKMDGEAITSKRLLEHYHLTVAKDTTLVENAAIAKEAVVAKEAVITAVVEELPKPSYSPSSDENQGELKPPICDTPESVCASAELKAIEEAKNISSSSEPLLPHEATARTVHIKADR